MSEPTEEFCPDCQNRTGYWGLHDPNCPRQIELNLIRTEEKNRFLDRLYADVYDVLMKRSEAENIP